jgi:sialate O-acetylesterase
MPANNERKHLMRVSTCVLAVILANARLASAEVQLPGVFSDHLVLQRDLPIPIWGTAGPEEKIVVQFLDRKVSATADKEGRWSVKLAPLKAGGPYELTIQGQNTIVLKDVVVGEVWLCSGQSNMAMGHGDLITPAMRQARQAPAGDELRLFNTPATPAGSTTVWAPCSFDTAINFSAVGLYFGRDVQKALGVHIGLINAAWGSTPVQSFYAPRPAEKVLQGGPKFEQLVRPVQPYAIRGAIWYQGEANLHEAYNYRSLLPVLVKSWRDLWQQGDFPFLVAQQHSYGNQELMAKCAEMRESQFVAVRAMTNAGIVVTADRGNGKHPRDKEPVGARLALAARAVAYKERLVHEGPLFGKATIADGKVRISFGNLGGGLTAKGNKVTGFTIAAEDRQFVDAEAVLDGSEIVVSSPQVATPVAVRYGWGDPTAMSLFNREGLPAFPFRTDDFPVTTQPPPKTP